MVTVGDIKKKLADFDDKDEVIVHDSYDNRLYCVQLKVLKHTPIAKLGVYFG